MSSIYDILNPPPTPPSPPLPPPPLALKILSYSIFPIGIIVFLLMIAIKHCERKRQERWAGQWRREPRPRQPPPPSQLRAVPLTPIRIDIDLEAGVQGAGSRTRHDRGASPYVAQWLQNSQVRMPTSNYRSSSENQMSKVTECAICLEELREGCESLVLLGCNHIFHTECIIQWSKTHTWRNPTCPICRSDIYAYG